MIQHIKRHQYVLTALWHKQIGTEITSVLLSTAGHIIFTGDRDPEDVYSHDRLEEEYLNCLEKLNMEPTDLIKLARNGFEVADLNLDKKKDLFVEINKLVQEIDEGRFSE